MKRMSLFILCLISSTAGIQAISESYSVIYKAKRLLGPSSVKKLAKMSQAEKDKELRFYLQQEAAPYTGLSITKSKATGEITFKPRAKYLKEIMYLIKHGASPNLDAHYEWQHTLVSNVGTFKPIYLFLYLGDEANVRILLEHGATLDNIIQSHGSIVDPLTFAKTTNMATLLLEHGAQISAEIKEMPCPRYVYFGPAGPTGLARCFSLVEALSHKDFNAELIPLYCSHYKGATQEFAQAVWEQLTKYPYAYQFNKKAFYKKRDYLKNAGATYDAQWEDEKFIWE